MGQFRFSPRPVQDTDYDGVRVLGVLLRFPPDAASGGEVSIQRLKAGQPVGKPQVIALEPGAPDALASQAWGNWVLGVLQAKGLAPVDATPDDTPTGATGAVGRFLTGAEAKAADKSMLRL